MLIYVQGPNQWRYEKAWPIPDARIEKLYLSDRQSGSIQSVNDGSLSSDLPAELQASETYDYSPTLGPFLPTMLSNRDGRLKIDQSPFEEKTLTWTTDALAAPTEVTGTINFSFWAETNAEDTDFVVEITDVSPDGTSTQVTTGYLNASRAKSRSNPTPLTPGKIEQFSLETLPTSYVFEAGHRIRLSLAGGSQALKEQAGPQGPGLHPIAASVKIYQDVRHPSSLEIPVIGTAQLSSELRFKDVPVSHIHFRAIQILAEKGLLNGRDNDSFHPADHLTRAELATLVVRALGLQEKLSPPAFTDVKENDWFAQAISAVYGAGLMTGMDSDRFSPRSEVTREQAMEITARVYQAKNGGGKLETAEVDAALKNITDQDKLSDDARSAAAVLVRAGALSAEQGQLRPQDVITRAEAAQLLYNLLYK